jgi:hypothetical protein
MSGIKDRFLNRQWIFVTLGLIISLVSVFFAYQSFDLARQTSNIENQHYQELVKPHTLKEDISNKINNLDKTIPYNEKWIDSIEASGKDVSNLRDGLTYIQNLLIQSISQFNNDSLDEANNTIEEASRLAYNIRSAPLDIPFPPITITASPTLVSLGIKADDYTLATSMDGQPVKTITASIGFFNSTKKDITIVTTYDIQPKEIFFDKKVEISIVYEASSIPQDFKASDLKLAIWNYEKEDWEILTGSRVNISNDTISASTKHITNLAVLAIVKPPINVNWYLVGGLVFLFILVIVVSLTLFLPERIKKDKPQIIIPNK